MSEDGRTEGSPGTTHTGVVKLEEQLKPELPGAPHTPHPLNPHNTTCMACFTSKVRCDRQVPCARCARLNLLCKPNPRKPGRPSRTLKQPSQAHYPSGPPAAQFPYHHVPPANHASCYCLPPAGMVIGGMAPQAGPPSTGRPTDPKLYSMHPMMPYPLTGLPLPHGPTTCSAPPPYQPHYHTFQLAQPPPSATSPSGPTPQVGVGDEEWTEVCQLLSDMPVPPSPTGTNTVIANAFQAFDRCTNGGGGDMCGNESAYGTTGTAPPAYHQYHHHPFPAECYSLMPRCCSSTAAPGGGVLAAEAMGGDGGLATEKCSHSTFTTTTSTTNTSSPCPSPRALIHQHKLSLKCTIRRESVVHNSMPPSPNHSAPLLPCPTLHELHELPYTTSHSSGSHTPPRSSGHSNSHHVLHHHHHHHHAPVPLPPPPPPPLPAAVYTTYPAQATQHPLAEDKDKQAIMSSFAIVSKVVGRVATGATSHNKATAVLSSWHCWNLLLGQDTSHGLLGPLARTFRLELPRVLAPVSLDVSDAEHAERSMMSCLTPLWALTDPAVAVCSVCWCRGQVRVMCSERFDSVFMHKTVLEEGIMASAKLPHLLWASLVSEASQGDYWDAWAEACFEDHIGLLHTDGLDSKVPAVKQRVEVGASRNLLVRDRFKLEGWMRATIGMYASPCGWYSCTWLVLV